jgi:hypothetical protein
MSTPPPAKHTKNTLYRQDKSTHEKYSLYRQENYINPDEYTCNAPDILCTDRKSQPFAYNTRKILSIKRKNGLTSGGQQICSFQPEQKNLKENAFFSVLHIG